MGELTAGKYTYGLPVTRRGNNNTVTIGAFCSIAQGVILDGGFQHNTKFISTFPFPTNFIGCHHLTGHVVCKGDITIGNDVWIGEDVVIMGGVTIGDGAVLGMRSIISKDVEPYSVVVGAPQKILRYRFQDFEIDMLLKIKWWEWPDEHIKNVAHILMSGDTLALANYHLLNINR